MCALGQAADLRCQVPDTRRAAHHEDGESMLIKPETAPQRLLLAWRRRPESQIDGQAEQLHAVGRHPAPQRHLPRLFGRGDHQIGLAERPPPVEVDQVRDHRHQRARPATLPDRLVGDVVQERMDREDHIRVVLPE